MTSFSKASRWQIFAILAVGVFCVSTAAIFIRLSLAAVGQPSVGFSLLLAASRLAIASVVLIPTWRQFQPSTYQPGGILYSSLSGFLLASHFATWITSLSYTSIAASTTLVTTNPIWVALLSWWWFREKLSMSTLIGIAITLVGSISIGLQGATGDAIGQNPALGNGLALVGSWAFSLHFLLGRAAQRRGINIRQHVAIAYSTAALILLPLPLFFGSSYLGLPMQIYGWIVLMALVPQLLGHTSLNWAVHHISPTLVTLVILLEPISSSVLGYLVFGEVPGTGVLIGAILILMGVAIAAAGSRNA